METAAAKATDFRKDCCADDEERIAELEASLARKKNRDVSLTVSGFANEAFFGGRRHRAQRTSARVRGSRRAFDSSVTPGSTATVSITIRKSSWFLRSKTFGKLIIGKDASAMFHLLDDGNGTNAATFADPETSILALGAFRVRDSNGRFINSTGAGGALRWIDLLNGAANDVIGKDGLRELVRYDSPETAGFAVTSTWGGDDLWAVALSYKGPIGDFDLTGRAGYSKSADEGVRCSPKPASLHEDCAWWDMAGTVQHNPTGLFVYGVYSGQEDASRNAAGSAADGPDRLWLIEGGLDQRWSD